MIGPDIYGISGSLPTNLEAFKEVGLEGNLAIPSGRPPIKKPLQINSDIEVLSVTPLQTLVVPSSQGQQLVVEGNCQLKFKYLGDDDQTIQLVDFLIPFYTSISSRNIDKYNQNITPYIQDIYFKALGGRDFFVTILFVLDLHSNPRR